MGDEGRSQGKIATNIHRQSTAGNVDWKLLEFTA